MVKYIVSLVVLIVVGAVFLYSTQTVQAPTQNTQQENPFGEPSAVVGTLDTAQETAQETGSATGNAAQQPASQPAAQNSGTVTRIELAKHNTQSNCWIGYKSTVYDITNWLPKHPGSAAAIAPFCGTVDEFAAAFNKQHGTKQENRLNREGVKEGALGN